MNNNNNDFPDVRNDGQGERSYMNLQNLNGYVHNTNSNGKSNGPLNGDFIPFTFTFPFYILIIFLLVKSRPTSVKQRRLLLTNVHYFRTLIFPLKTFKE